MIRHLTEPAPLAAPSFPSRRETAPEDALDLRRLDREADRLRQTFAGDPSVCLVVGLDLFIRRAAIRLRQACRALVRPPSPHDFAPPRS